jgi:hypothetical protein
MGKPDIYIALVHYPILNKQGDVVTTSVTNFDIHDLARNSKTYGVKCCFLVTPSLPQKNMIDHIKGYWQEGFGSNYNPDRKEAFDIIEHSNSIEESCLTIKKNHGINPLLIATSAKKGEKSVSFEQLKKDLDQIEKPILILFGTGWGLTQSVIEKTDHLLDPINGPTDYNHLPVRSAVAIVLDRLLGC